MDGRRFHRLQRLPAWDETDTREGEPVLGVGVVVWMVACSGLVCGAAWAVLLVSGGRRSASSEGSTTIQLALV